MKKLLATCIGMFSLLANAEGVQLSEKTLIREVVSSNAGQEIIVPFATMSSDKTKISLRFDVYPVGSTTKLFSTAAQTFTLPVLNCSTESTAQAGLNTWDAGLVSAPSGGANQVYAFEVNRYCTGADAANPWIQQTDTLIYGANVSSAAGAKWGLMRAKTSLRDMAAINSDADADYELLLVTDTPKSVSGYATKTRVEILNMVTGAVEVAAKDRVVKSTNLANMYQ
jgi:hypothetical protein